MTTGDFMTRYADYVSRLMEPLGPNDGVPESEIIAAEERLGVRLPRLLREFYLRVGNREDICQVHNRLRSPARLERVGNVVAFYAENQGCTYWGVDISGGTEDPPVPLAGSIAQLATPVFVMDRLSDFLLFELFSQAGNGTLNGGAPCRGYLDGIEFELPTQPPEGWELLYLPEWEYRVFVGPSQALFVNPGFGYAAARDADSFRVLMETFELEGLIDIYGCADLPDEYFAE